MKKMLRSAGVLLAISALFTPAAQAYLTVVGNATVAGQTFLVAPNKASFFRPTGEYYFGLTAGGGNYALCYGTYRTPDTAPTLSAIGSGAGVTNLNVDHLAVVPNSAAVTSPTIVAAIGTANTVGTLSAISKTVATPVTQALNDPTAAPTSGIRALTASRSATTGANVVFAAVKVTGGVGAGTPFGAGANAAGGAGTATDGINAALITQTAGTPAFTYTGANGVNTARVVDLTAAGTYALGAAAGVTVVQGANPAFCYDEQLGRLYVGIQGEIAGQGGGNTGSIFGVGIYPVTITGTSVAVGAALQPNGNAASAILGLGGTTIVGVTSAANTAASTSILKLKTMHTSTGLPYLIVNGNSLPGATGAVALQVSNQIWAVPLVGTNAAVATQVGCFASVNSGNHSVMAGAGGGANDFIVNTSLAAAIGGTGTAPISHGGAAANPGCVSDIYVDNDAVYVATTDGATGNTPTGLSEPGLWKSQAVFNDLGQIDHWTDWQKVAPNDMCGNVQPSTGADGSVDFAAVDAYTGHVWTTNLTSLTSYVTQWTQPTTATPNSQQYLAAAVNTALSNQCYSVLDLNASVTGWGAATPTRLTLFGGNGAVCFAITGSRGTTAATIGGTYTSINMSLADSLYDYTQTATFFKSTLPATAGAVISLGFSGWDPDGNGTTPGFFFAGCAGTATSAPALYVFTPGGTTGFNATTVGGTTLSIMTDLGLTTGTATWAPVTNVSGMPVKIQSLGGAVHVLTRTATLDRVYSCPKVETAALVNSSFVVTASSGYAPSGTASSLASVAQIYDLVLTVSPGVNLANGAPQGFEQLGILTNDGIYTTSSSVGMQTPTSQLNAGWELIDGTSSITTAGYFADYVQAPSYNRAPQTFWVADYASNSVIPAVYNRTIQYQISRQGFVANNAGNLIPNATTFSAEPTVTATFNGATSFAQTTAPTIYQNFPVLARLFYNDGSRRFFVQKNPNNDATYQVLALPYNLYDYNITANGKTPMADAAVAAAGAFYWCSPIGATGRLMMGTSNGVISLQ